MSYRVVRRASKCPQTRMNTGFFIELSAAEYLAVLPDIGKFGAKIGAAIRVTPHKYKIYFSRQ